jgi:hypothetical protein
MGIGLVIGFVEFVQFAITSNYNAFPNSPTPLLSTTQAMYSTSSVVFAW